MPDGRGNRHVICDTRRSPDVAHPGPRAWCQPTGGVVLRLALTDQRQMMPHANDDLSKMTRCLNESLRDAHAGFRRKV